VTSDLGPSLDSIRPVTSPTAGLARVRARADARLIGLLLVVVSACAFGSGPLLAKPVYATGVDWLTLLFWRFLIAAVVSWIWLLAVPANRAGLQRLSQRRVVILVGLGVLYVCNSGTYFAGLETVPASLAALIVYVYPALVAVLTLRFGQRLEGRRAWIALAIASIGVVLAVGGIPEGSAPPISGLLLVISSPVFYAIWIVAAARLGGERRRRVTAVPPADSETAPVARSTEPAPATALMTSATAASFFVLMLLSGHSVSPASVPSDAWPGLIGVALIATALAVPAFYAGARRIGAARAALASTVEPIYTIALAAILLGESLAPIQLVGGALILGGVLLAETGAGRKAG
jgi:drug/metabolite transporter (DMT)-like permease